MKKVLKFGLALITISFLCFLASCSLSEKPSKDNSSSSPIFEELQEDGYQGNQEDLLNTLKNETQKNSDSWIKQDSAYDSAVDNGYKGSMGEWLEILVGSSKDEEKYSKGKTVYELAVLNGFKGTLEDWLESLKTTLPESSINPTERIPEDNSKTASEEFFTVTFKNYNGELIKIENVKKGESATPPPTPSRDGYTFIGWDRTFNKIEFDTIVNAVFEKITKPTIIVDRVDSSAGEKKVAVNIAVKNNPGISSLNLNVTYAPELTLKNVKYNKDLKGQSMKPGQEESPIKLTWVSPFEDMTGDWVFATLYFDVSEDATGDLPVCITYDMENIYNMEEENIYFDVVDGAIAITK